jgi:hypothetical protein
LFCIICFTLKRFPRVKAEGQSFYHCNLSPKFRTGVEYELNVNENDDDEDDLGK